MSLPFNFTVDNGGGSQNDFPKKRPLGDGQLSYNVVFGLIPPLMTYRILDARCSNTIRGRDFVDLSMDADPQMVGSFARFVDS
jgi:hypothetical protein